MRILGFPRALVALLLVGLLAACGQKPADGPYPSGGDASPSTASASPAAGGDTSSPGAEAPSPGAEGSPAAGGGAVQVSGKTATINFTISDAGLSPPSVEAPPGLTYNIVVKNETGEKATFRVEGQKDTPTMEAGGSGDVSLKVGPGKYVVRVPEKEGAKEFWGEIVISQFQMTK